jgi:hypothetical protein
MRAVLAIMMLLVAGCALPQWRVFQKTVPQDTGPTPAVVEAQRAGAKFIERKSAAPEQNPTKQLAAIHAVATPLSRSLGEPSKPIEDGDTKATIAGLQRATLDAQAKATAWRDFSRKHGGAALEDTGINLAGPAGLLGLIGIVAACIAFPPIGYLLLRALPVLWGFFRSTTGAVAEFATSHPDAAVNLKATLSRKMDSAHKQLVRVRGVKLTTP